MVHTSSAVIFGAIALNAASALATPMNVVDATSHQVRDVNENNSQLEERRIGSFLGKAAPFLPLLSFIPGLGGQQRRDVDELEARRLRDTLKNAAPWAPLVPLALDFIKSKPAQPPAEPAPIPPQRREIEEFLGRDLSDHEARGLGKFLGKAAPFTPFLSMIPGFGGQQRRDVNDLGVWGPLIPAGLYAANGGERMGPPPPQRREIEQMLERELSDVEARGLDGILDTVSQIAPWLPMIGGMLPESKPRPPKVPTKPAALRGKPKRSEEADESLEARRLRSTFDKVAPWGTVIGIGADLIRQKLSPKPAPAPVDPNAPAPAPVRRDTHEDNVLEARATPKGGKSGKSTMNRIGSGLGTAAAFAPLIGLGIDAVNQGQMRRDIDEQFWARGGEDDEGLEARDFAEEFSERDVEDDDHLEARAPPKGGKSGKSTLSRIGSGLGTTAAFAPLIGLGLSALTQGQMRRDLKNQFWARDAEDDDHLEVRAPPGGGKGGKSTLSRIGSGLGTAAAFAPLIGLGVDAVNQGRMRRELYEELLARDADDELEERDFDDADDLVARDLEELLDREVTDIEARGFGTKLGKVAPYVPLIATGLSLFGGMGQARRDVSEELMDIFHRELSESLEDLD
ncbi:hypothetical protein BDN71DRAFT_1590066 [Pleurotus eryngii]|uniref:Uncharacterized protein n=1 Tax=Pleurotus eryngii TaxID=5323 RepID=A0A9P6DGG8_PLEER|nr:hypothetical protein BDN71DRAFT_1590066 [Pleurotus eryngii]